MWYWLRCLDLHGLLVDEAEKVLTFFLLDWRASIASPSYTNSSDGCPTVVKIITGAGKHSSNGRPVLEPAVVSAPFDSLFIYQAEHSS